MRIKYLSSWRGWCSGIIAAAALLACSPALAEQQRDGKWLRHGRDLRSSNNAKDEDRIDASNINKLIIKWEAETTPELPGGPFTVGEVTGRPVVDRKAIYYGDKVGNVYARSREDGSLLWHKFAPAELSSPGKEINGFAAPFAVRGKRLIIGNDLPLIATVCPQISANFGNCVQQSGAVVAALDKRTGDLLWSTNVDSHPAAKIRGGPVIYKGAVYVPVSSWEEEFTSNSTEALFGGDPNKKYPCCTFRGSVVKLDLKTGVELARYYTTPSADEIEAAYPGFLKPGESAPVGGAIWSGITIDRERNQLYVGTGNNYSATENQILCERNRRDPMNNPAPALPGDLTCGNLNEKLGNNFASVIALGLDDLSEQWVYRSRSYDSWVHACAQPDFYLAVLTPGLINNAVPENILNCPNVNGQFFPGPDVGFSMAPMLMRNVGVAQGDDDDDDDRGRRRGRKDILAIGNKDGGMYILDAETGKLERIAQTGPGGILGGLMYSAANDGRTIYTLNTNSNNVSRDVNLPFARNLLFLDPLIPDDEAMPGPAESILGPIFGFTPSGSGYGTLPEATYTLINPPQQAIDEADGVSTFWDGQKLTTITSFVSAIDAASGDILWQAPIPTGGRPPANYNVPTPPLPLFSTQPSGGGAFSGVSLANGVVYAGSATDGTILEAFDAETGKRVYRFQATYGGVPAGANTEAPSIVQGEIYLGGGLSQAGILSFGGPGLTGGVDLRSNKIYALCLDNDENGICDNDEELAHDGDDDDD